MTRMALALGATLAGIAAPAAQAALIGDGTPYVLTSPNYAQDFDSLAPTGSANTALPAGWQAYEGGASGDGYYVGGVSNSSGGIHAYGSFARTERALGGLPHSGVTPIYFGAFFENGLGGTIDSLNIAYTGEQWWNGFYRGTLSFQYSLDATSIDSGTWISFTALDFLSPDTTTPSSQFSGVARDGNAAAYRSDIAGTISSLSIAQGGTFGIRWTLADMGANQEDGLAVDDFSLTASLASQAVPEPASWAMMIGGFGLIGSTLRRQRGRGAGPAVA